MDSRDFDFSMTTLRRMGPVGQSHKLDPEAWEEFR